MTLGRLLLVLSLPLYVIDQITKWWVVMRFSDPEPGLNYTRGEAIEVIEGYFNIVRVHNQGVAFGMGNGTTWAPVVFLIVPFVALGVLAYFHKRGALSTKLLRVAGALLVTGILGNLTDRLLQGFFLERYAEASFWERLSQGYVVDFLDFFIPVVNYRWPSFNVADSCISIAAVLLIISTFREDGVSKSSSEQAASE